MGAFFLSFDTSKRVLMRRRYGDGVKNKGPTDFDIMLLAGSTAGVSFWTGTSRETPRPAAIRRAELSSSASLREFVTSPAFLRDGSRPARGHLIPIRWSQ